jgi:hypothetical protein
MAGKDHSSAIRIPGHADWMPHTYSRPSKPIEASGVAMCAEVPSPRRLDGRSQVLLAASIKMQYDGPGWIANKEAMQFFSPLGDSCCALRSN